MRSFVEMHRRNQGSNSQWQNNDLMEERTDKAKNQQTQHELKPTPNDLKRKQCEIVDVDDNTSESSTKAKKKLRKAMMKILYF